MNVIYKRAEIEPEFSVNILLDEPLWLHLRNDEGVGLNTDGGVRWVHCHCSMERTMVMSRQ
jgi:hypothetical protein